MKAEASAYINPQLFEPSLKRRSKENPMTEFFKSHVADVKFKEIVDKDTSVENTMDIEHDITGNTEKKEEKKACNLSLIEQDFVEAAKLLDAVEITEKNIDLVIGQILCLFRIALRIQGKTDKEISHIIERVIEQNVKNLQSNFTDWKQLALHIASGVISIGAGAAGIGAGMGLGSMIGLTDTKQLLKIIQQVGSASQGVSSFGQVAGSFQSAEKTGLEQALEVNRNQRRQATEEAGQKDQMGIELMRKIDQLLQQLHSAFMDQAKMQ